MCKYALRDVLRELLNLYHNGLRYVKKALGLQWGLVVGREPIIVISNIFFLSCGQALFWHYGLRAGSLNGKSVREGQLIINSIFYIH